MDIAIIGHGRMGQKIMEVSSSHSVRISQVISNKLDLERAKFHPKEVAIEFTEPSACLDNLRILSSKNVTTICGTTGWHENVENVKEMYFKRAGFLYAANFSIGVNIFWHILKSAARTINQFPDYDVSIHETHHNKKKDCPSGTAIATGDIILQGIDKKKRLITNLADKTIDPEEIHISYSRSGNTIGEHEVTFAGSMDSIKILHQSTDRATYAHGAIKCAKWLQNKKGFYSMESYIKHILHV
jgi:4-hydroxy-tetrahydrodipicolinate reductase